MPQTAETFERDRFDIGFSREDTEVKRLFPTPFVVAPVVDYEALNAQLARIILERVKGHASVQRSNAGGWQSDIDFPDWAGPPGEALLIAARRLADAFTAVDGEDGLEMGGPEWKVNAWANVNGPGDANRAHHHPAAFWSGVYWVDAGQVDGADCGGQFEIQDPRGVLPAFYAPRVRYAVAGCLSAGGEDFFVPRTGVMVLFPAWMVHAVRAYSGPRRRISVAFNLSI